MIQVDPESGAIIATFNLADYPQFERNMLGSDSEIVVVNEPHWVQV